MAFKPKVISKADQEGPRPKNGQGPNQVQDQNPAQDGEDPTKRPLYGSEGSVDMHHPDYDEHLADWKLVRDCIVGNRAVKDQGETYLPKPEGFTVMDDGGVNAYKAYKLRAQFPRITEPTQRGMVGVIHRKEAHIEMPPAMEYLKEKTTKDGLPLDAFHRRITRELLATGRYGVFVDMSSTGDGDPWLCGYDAEHIINWSEFSDFFVLDETRDVRQGFAWVEQRKFRVLELISDGVDDPNINQDDPNVPKSYRVRVFDGKTDSVSAKEFNPTIRGGGQWDEVPFVIIGSTDVMNQIDEVPLLSVAEAAMATYRLDADYRHQLYMSGQETFMCTGLTKEERPRVVGAGVVLTLPKDCTAEYVSPTCNGIDAHAKAIESEMDKAASAGARMFSSKDTKTAESGDALKIRVAGQTATLLSIAMSSAAGLERALKKLAKFMGLNEDQVTVIPNLSFIDAVLTPADALQLVKIWQAGVLSKQTVYEAMQRGEIASGERTFDEEQTLIEDEMPPPGSDPNVMAPPPNDQQLQAFRDGGLPPANGQMPPGPPRPGAPKPGAFGGPPGGAVKPGAKPRPGFPNQKKPSPFAKKAA